MKFRVGLTLSVSLIFYKAGLCGLLVRYSFMRINVVR